MFQILPNVHSPIHFIIPSRTAVAISLGSFNPSTFNLKNPSNLKDSVQYDPKTNLYYLMEKIGNKWYRTPTAYTYEEYLQLSARQSEDNYFPPARRHAGRSESQARTAETQCGQ